MIEAVLGRREPGFELEVELLVTCIQRRYRLDWVPIGTIYAGESGHIRSGRHVAGFLRMAWKAGRESRRASPG